MEIFRDGSKEVKKVYKIPQTKPNDSWFVYLRLLKIFNNYYELYIKTKGKEYRIHTTITKREGEICKDGERDPIRIHYMGYWRYYPRICLLQVSAENPLG